MDIGQAFGFVFQDEDWLKKVLIGAVLALTGIGFIPIIGYGMEVARRVAKGHPQPLPEWDDWGRKIIEGFMSGIVVFVWSLPVVLMGACAGIIAIPLSDTGGDAGGFLFAGLMLCVGLFILLYSLILGLVLPAALTNYAVTGEFGAALRFGEVFGMIRSNLGVYLMVLLVTVLAQFVASLGSIAVGCGVLFTSFYSVLVMYHAYGQAYRVAAGNVDSQASVAY